MSAPDRTAAEERALAMRYARRLARLALWTAVGVVLAGLERLLPQPVPWAKLGIANLAALLVLYGFGWRAALLVNVARVIVVALLLGTWATPVGVLSMGGAVVAVLAMAAVRKLSRNRVGMIGVSAAGGFAHVLTQFALAALLIVRHTGVFVFTGPSLLLAVGSGVLLGVVAMLLYSRLPEPLLREGVVR